MCVCTHICTFEFYFLILGVSLECDFHPVINSMTVPLSCACFSPLLPTSLWPLAPGPYIGGVLENDCATLRYMDGHGCIKRVPIACSEVELGSKVEAS